jgi:hypothetical protein
MWNDDDCNKLLLMDSNLCLKLVPLFISVIISLYTSAANFFPISYQNFGLRPLLWYVLPLWSRRRSIFLTSSIRYVLSIAPTFKSYANCCRCLTRLSPWNKPILLGQSQELSGDTMPVRLVSVLPLPRTIKSLIFTSLFRVCPDCCVMSLWLQCSQTIIQGSVEIPDDLAKQFWAELLAWEICP